MTISENAGMDPIDTFGNTSCKTKSESEMD